MDLTVQLVILCAANVRILRPTVQYARLLLLSVIYLETLATHYAQHHITMTIMVVQDQMSVLHVLPPVLYAWMALLQTVKPVLQILRLVVLLVVFLV